MIDTDLKKIERDTYRSTADTGLLDLLIACPFVMLAIAPLLSGRLGDLWSSVVFLPFFAAVFAVIRILKVRVVEPRIGVVEFARPRRQRLLWLNVVMMTINIGALIAGFFAFTLVPVAEGRVVSLGMSLMLLVGFSLAALFLGIPRFFFYGLMMAVAPIVGEELFSRGYASHHGFPIVFGVGAAVIVVCGIVRFIQFLPPPHAANGLPMVEGTDE